MTGKALDAGIAKCGNGVTIFWQPALDGSDEPYDPKHFTPNVLRQLQVNRDVWDTQYRLKGPEEGGGEFDEKTLHDFMFRYVAGRTQVEYPAISYDPDDLDNDGAPKLKTKRVKKPLSSFRFFLTVDPTHRKDDARISRRKGKERPSEHAIVVTGVGPDMNVIVPDYWSADCKVGDMLTQLFKMYRMWAPYRVCYEDIGAQVWLEEMVQQQEQRHFHLARPQAHTPWGERIQLRKMSQVMIPAEHRTASKEAIYRQVLSPWVNGGALHLCESKNETMMDQLLGTANFRQAVDLVDCLAQGPLVWSKPPIQQRRRGIKDESQGRLQWVMDFIRGTSKRR